VDIASIAGAELGEILPGIAAGLIQTTDGPVVAEFHNYAHYGKGSSIHSSIQIEAWGAQVNDKSKQFSGGTQSITTLDGYVIPLLFKGD